MKLTFRITAIAVSLLLAGCDGYMKIEGHIAEPNGTPLANVPIYLFIDGKADEYDPVLWSDTNGHFEIGKVSCPCDFPVELIATSPDYGIARYVTTHKALQKNPNVMMRLAERPKPPLPERQVKQSCPPEKGPHP